MVFLLVLAAVLFVLGIFTRDLHCEGPVVGGVDTRRHLASRDAPLGQPGPRLAKARSSRETV
jgi:hypothetical protein